MWVFADQVTLILVSTRARISFQTFGLPMDSLLPFKFLLGAHLVFEITLMYIIMYVCEYAPKPYIIICMILTLYNWVDHFCCFSVPIYAIDVIDRRGHSN